jgi:hypothetical protein
LRDIRNVLDEIPELRPYPVHHVVALPFSQHSPKRTQVRLKSLL